MPENQTQTPAQLAQRLEELAQQIETQAFPRHQIAEGFRLIAQAIAPADAAA